MRRWLNIPRLPVAIGAILLVIPWFYLGWNTTIGEIFPTARFRTKSTVAGTVKEASDGLSLHAVLTGHYQQSISRAIGRLSPVFKPAVRWKNQIYYSLLGTSGANGVVIGRHHELLATPYLTEYCARDAAAFRTEAASWAASIRTIADRFQAAGLAFVYVVTPSKVAQYPQFIPNDYKCPARATPQADKLSIWDQALASHGVPFVDAAAILSAVRERYSIDMFARGSIHWNHLSAALGSQALITAVNAQHPARALTPFTFAWQVSYAPIGLDRDLLDILNLPFPDAHYPVPLLSYRSDPRGEVCEPAKITEIGASFLFAINETLEKTACPPAITLWYYWDHNHFLYAGGERKELPMDEGVRRRSLFDADVVVLEENEAGLPDSQPAEKLINELQTIKVEPDRR
jgi:hypothetical protein